MNYEELQGMMEKDNMMLEEGEKQKKHILVVDDDARIQRIIKMHLKDYDVATAISGKVALQFLEDNKTDLILLDYEMPKENGAEVLRKIRANEQTKDLPVVFLTGIADRKKIQEVLLLEPQGYLLKPINRVKLLETIEKIIG